MLSREEGAGHRGQRAGVRGKGIGVRGKGIGGRGQGSEAGGRIPNPQSLIPSPLRHGEAVAIGMVLATRLAERLGRLDVPLADRIAALLLSFGLPIEAPPFAADRVSM